MSGLFVPSWGSFVRRSWVEIDWHWYWPQDKEVPSMNQPYTACVSAAESPFCGWRPWNYTESQSLSRDYSGSSKLMLSQPSGGSSRAKNTTPPGLNFKPQVTHKAKKRRRRDRDTKPGHWNAHISKHSGHWLIGNLQPTNYRFDRRILTAWIIASFHIIGLLIIQF